MFFRIKSIILFTVLALLIPAFSYGFEPQGTASSRKSLSGGYNYYGNNGKYLGKSTPNVFGGYNYYNSRGTRYTQTAKSGTGYRRIGK